MTATVLYRPGATLTINLGRQVGVCGSGIANPCTVARGVQPSSTGSNFALVGFSMAVLMSAGWMG